MLLYCFLGVLQFFSTVPAYGKNTFLSLLLSYNVSYFMGGLGGGGFRLVQFKPPTLFKIEISSNLHYQVTNNMARTPWQTQLTVGHPPPLDKKSGSAHMMSLLGF